jgi:5'-AMP-activated protein kinase regulatory gamma subunit
MDRTIEELGIGTFTRIATVQLDTTLLVALNLFLSRRVSALPIVDGFGRLLAVYSKADVLNLAADKTYANLMDSMERVLRNRSPTGCITHCVASLTCNRSESLKSVVDRIIKNGLHRLFAVDDEGRVEGIISLSDILRRLVLSPEESQDSTDSSGSMFSDRLIDVCDD